ncbi:MAG: hypothetical protein QM489_00890 [Candidatus Izemoplasma sp.]
MSTFVKLLNKQKTSSIARQSRRSAKWFQNKIKEFTKGIRKQQASRPVIGKLYTYSYSPKHKETLPHYDLFPMVMPFGMYTDGWIGINFHYLPPRLRAVLMDELLKINGKKNLNAKTKLQLSYDLLNKLSNSKLIAPTIHRYLIGHVKSKIIVIPANEWELAVMLPTAKFVGKSKQQIYSLAK